MDYFDGFGRKSDRLKTFLSALFGALVGGILMALLIFRFYLPEGLDSLPNNYPPRTEQPEIEFKEQDLPEYQDTAIVRSAERLCRLLWVLSIKPLFITCFKAALSCRHRKRVPVS